MAKIITKTSEKKERKPVKESRYIEGIGRRKTAAARVRIYPGQKKGGVVINNAPLKIYFPTARLQQTVCAPFKVTDIEFEMTVKVAGGGLGAQATAVQLGLARALISHDKTLRAKLKPRGYLTRDPRMVERKKPGLRKARRPQQWRKR